MSRDTLNQNLHLLKMGEINAALDSWLVSTEMISPIFDIGKFLYQENSEEDTQKNRSIQDQMKKRFNAIYAALHPYIPVSRQLPEDSSYDDYLGWIINNFQYVRYFISRNTYQYSKKSEVKTLDKLAEHAAALEKEFDSTTRHESGHVFHLFAPPEDEINTKRGMLALFYKQLSKKAPQFLQNIKNGDLATSSSPIETWIIDTAVMQVFSSDLIAAVNRSLEFKTRNAHEYSMFGTTAGAHHVHYESSGNRLICHHEVPYLISVLDSSQPGGKVELFDAKLKLTFSLAPKDINFQEDMQATFSMLPRNPDAMSYHAEIDELLTHEMVRLGKYRRNTDVQVQTILADLVADVARKIIQQMTEYREQKRVSEARSYRASILIVMAEGFIEQYKLGQISVDDCHAFMESCYDIHERHNKIDHHWYNKTNRFNDALERALPMKLKGRFVCDRRFSSSTSMKMSQKFKEKLSADVAHDEGLNDISDRFGFVSQLGYFYERIVTRHFRRDHAFIADFLKSYVLGDPETQKQLLITVDNIMDKMPIKKAMFSNALLTQTVQTILSLNKEEAISSLKRRLHRIFKNDPAARDQIDQAILLRSFLYTIDLATREKITEEQAVELVLMPSEIRSIERSFCPIVLEQSIDNIIHSSEEERARHVKTLRSILKNIPGAMQIVDLIESLGPFFSFVGDRNIFSRKDIANIFVAPEEVEGLEEKIARYVFTLDNNVVLLDEAKVLRKIFKDKPKILDKIQLAIQWRLFLNNQMKEGIQISAQEFLKLMSVYEKNAEAAVKSVTHELDHFSGQLSNSSFRPDSLSPLFESIVKTIESFKINAELSEQSPIDNLYIKFCNQQLSLDDIISSVLSAVNMYLTHDNIIKKAMANSLIIERVRDVLRIVNAIDASLDDSHKASFGAKLSDIKAKISGNETVKDAYERVRDSLQFNISLGFLKEESIRDLEALVEDCHQLFDEVACREFYESVDKRAIKKEEQESRVQRSASVVGLTGVFGFRGPCYLPKHDPSDSRPISAVSAIA